jgi:hypothetical protein
MKLATISGVKGVYTDEDFARVREAALAARERATSSPQGASDKGHVAGPSPWRGLACQDDVTDQ